MKSLSVILRLLSIALLTVALGACSGSINGGDEITDIPTVGAAATLSGTVATGAPVGHTDITFKGSNGVIANAVTDSLGHYTLDADAASLEFPVLTRATNPLTNKYMYGFASEPGVSNIHPFTDPIVRAWYKVNSSMSIGMIFNTTTAVALPSESEIKIIQEVVSIVIRDHLKIVETELTGGVTADTFDLFNTPFVADGTGFDKVLDGINVSSDENTGDISMSVDPTSVLGNTVSTDGGAATVADINTTSVTPTVTSDTTPPATPTGLTGTRLNSQQALLTWATATDNIGVVYYKIYQGSAEVATVTSTAFIVTGLTQGVTYNFTVKAFDAAQNASYASSPVTVNPIVQSDTTPPTFTTPPIASALSTSQIKLTWSAIDDNAISYHMVERNGVKVAQVMGTSYTDFGLLPSTTYNYVITAYDGAGNFTPATVPPATTPAPVDSTPPTTPSPLTATVTSNTSVALVWGPSMDEGGIAGYEVYRGTTLISLVTGSATRVYTDTGLATANQYCYQVLAYDLAGNKSDRSAQVCATVSDTQPPSAPSALSATPVSSSSVNLTWTASTDNVAVTGYNIYRNYVKVGASASASYPDTGLYAATQYCYEVTARDAAGNESDTSTLVCTTTQPATVDTEAPTVPGSLTATPATSSSASLTWTPSVDNVGVIGYNVYRGGIKVGSAFSTSYSDASLLPSVMYCYNVTAIDVMGNESAQSNQSCVALSDTVPPTAPGSPAAAQASSNSIAITWTQSTDDTGVAGYNIYRAGALAGTSLTTSYTETGLVPAAQYCYTITATDVAGNESVPSTQACSPLVDTQAPTTPGSPAVTQSSGSSANFTFNTSTDNVGVAQYVIYRNGVTIGTAASASYLDINLSLGTQYCYQAMATDAAGNVSGQSAQACITLTDTTAPTVPGTPAVTPAPPGSMGLSWTASTDNVGVSAYNVYRNGAIIISSAGTTYTDTGLMMGTSYCYTITATDSSGNESAQSTQACASITDTQAPTAPGTPMATQTSSSSANITWSAATDNVSVTQYNIYRNSVLVSTSTGLSYSDTGMALATSYCYQVTALDPALNESAMGAQGCITLTDATAPTTPGSLGSTQASASSATLSWTASADDVAVSGYNVYRNGSLRASSAAVGYTDAGLALGISYCYQVTATDAAGNESGTSNLSCIVLADSSAPTAPTGLGVTQTSSTSVSLTWTASTDDVGVSGYNIIRDGASIGTSPTAGYSNPGLTLGTTYCYTVSAFDAAGNTSAESTQACLTMADTVAPSVPASVTVTQTSVSSIDLSWNASTDDVGVTGYNIFRDGVFLSSATGTPYADTGLTLGTTYCYTVSAYDAVPNTSAESTSACLATSDVTAPTMPTSVTAVASSSSTIDLSWVASTDDVAVTGYKIYRGGIYLTTTTMGSPYTDTGLSPSTNYCYEVSAVDAVGNESAKSTAVCVNTLPAGGEAHSASGTYSYDSMYGDLFMSWEMTDFLCEGPGLGPDTQYAISVTDTTMTWSDMTWTRTPPGGINDVTGTWTAVDPLTGNTYTLTYNLDSTMVLTATIVSCGDASIYNADGTYTYDGMTLTLYISTSDFICEGPQASEVAPFSVISITDTMMTLDDGSGSSTWVRSVPGAAGDPVGTWIGSPDGGGNTYQLAIDGVGNFTMTGAIYYCGYGPGPHVTLKYSSGGYNLDFSYGDTGGTVVDASVTAGYGIGSPILLGHDIANNVWASWVPGAGGSPNIGFAPPPIPTDYTFSLFNGVTPWTETATLNCSIAEYPTNPYAVDNGDGSVTFYWNPIGQAGIEYSVHMHDSMDNCLDNNYSVVDSNMLTIPAVADDSYQYWINARPVGQSGCEASSDSNYFTKGAFDTSIFGGTWIMDYSGSLGEIPMYITFDITGHDVLDFGTFNEMPPYYSVVKTYYPPTGNFTWDLQMSQLMGLIHGTLVSPDQGDMYAFEQPPSAPMATPGSPLQRVTDTGLCMGIRTLTLTDNDMVTIHTITITVDSMGLVTSFSSPTLPTTYSGHVYCTPTSMAAFLYNTMPVPTAYDQIKVGGFGSIPTFGGSYEVDNGMGQQGTFTFNQ